MRPARTLGLAVLLSSLSLCAALAPAQQNQTVTPPTPTPAPSPTPAPLLTKLSVRVLDEKGMPVKGLRTEDFQVQEDGVPQTISSVSDEGLPVSYVLVVDNTGSMRSQLDQLIDISRAIIVGNQPGDETAIVRFVSSDKIEVLQEFTTDQSQLNNALDMYIEGGQSAIVDAVYLAARLAAARGKQADGRRTALVLLTDGEERASFFKLADLLNYLRAESTQVYTVGFVRELNGKKTIERATNLLNTLSVETGGRAFYPENLPSLYPVNPIQLRETTQQIARDLRGQYLISYAPTNQARNDQYRKVQVTLTDKPSTTKRAVSTRAGYAVVNSVLRSPKEIEKQLKSLP